jgi:4-aminobutyrate aminotransferase-like enzyme
MIGFGHAPDSVLQAMARPHVMANVMTASFSQHRLVQRLEKEIGHTRKAKPFQKFLFVNSGSESVTVALRLSDINARRQTEPGQRHAGKRIMFLTLKGGFHGRTERPAQASNSSAKKYKETLATFRGLEVNHTVAPNDVEGLKAAFAWAQKEGVFFECMLMEPVMGEGDPGKAITPEFYRTARELTRQHGGFLLVDSIQAGLRAQGCLSITDYPGFQELDPPDMETYSKAVNAGQYPLSILAMRDEVASLYVRGVYGNTKTGNPRALDVAVAVLELVTPALRRNIVERGQELLQKFQGLAREFPDIVTKVQGTGLLCSIEVDPRKFAVVGKGQLEEYLRINGIGVIHGGENSLRFTPHFEISSREVDLIVDALRRAFKDGPRK